jgi:hypothetical protein
MLASSRRVHAVVAVGAPFFVGSALASNSASFGDASGDANPAPDITGVAITSDDAGSVNVKVTLGNRSALARRDEVTIGIDADQNPESGGVFYGADFELTLLGATPEFLLPGGDGYYHEAAKPASFEASSSNGVATFSFKASEVGISSGFNVCALGFVFARWDSWREPSTPHRRFARSTTSWTPVLRRPGSGPTVALHSTRLCRPRACTESWFDFRTSLQTVVARHRTPSVSSAAAEPTSE